MPRLTPSQVVALIDQLFPDARTVQKAQIGNGPELETIVRLCRQIPSELITVSGQDFADIFVSLEFMESTQQSSRAHGRGYSVQEYRGFSTIFLLRAALAKCLDEAPAPGTTELNFITDASLRDSIRRDISAANQDMANGGWKSATVLAGSATEALLLWGIQEQERRSPGAITSTVSALIGAGTLGSKPNPDPERWSFVDLIEVAAQLGLVKAETAMQARLGKDFRNLIHPGRANRLGQVCDRGTALSALAAVELVVRDLT